MGRTTLELGGWFILRCASADTLKLAVSLTRAGLGVWTPIEKSLRRTSRKRVPFDRQTPLMPGYLFAKTDGFDQLINMAALPGSDHPRFSVFVYLGGVPVIADDELGPLRAEEDRTLRIFERLKRVGKKSPVLAKGEEVRIYSGPMEGLTGVVEGHQGQYTLVCFPAFPKAIKISSFLLFDEQTPMVHAA